MINAATLLEERANSGASFAFNERLKSMTVAEELQVLVLVAGTSCMAAILNASGFYVIKSLSPLTYKVTSHLKTILTLVLGTAFFGEEMNIRQMCGFFICLLGIVAYSFIKGQEMTSGVSISSSSSKQDEKVNGDQQMTCGASLSALSSKLDEK